MSKKVGFSGVESKFMDDEYDSRNLLSRGRRRITATRGQYCEIDENCLNNESCINNKCIFDDVLKMREERDEAAEEAAEEAARNHWLKSALGWRGPIAKQKAWSAFYPFSLDGVGQGGGGLNKIGRKTKKTNKKRKKTKRRKRTVKKSKIRNR
jgi:hypothetical protein